MSLSVEELLIPRYKVIADYPGSMFGVGETIEAPLKGSQDFANRYPAIFRRMNWNEGRVVDGMFIKSVVTGKIIRYTEGYTDHFTPMDWDKWLPSTITEYEAFLTQKQK